MPSVQSVICDIAVIAFIDEVGFYYSHRLFHHPWSYKRIHKIHHEWTSPTALITMYCHPIEHAVANLSPLMIGAIVVRAHARALTMLVALTVGIWFSINDHCGYHFPLMTSPKAHDFHHLKFNANFGPLGILDWLHKTNKTFKKYENYQRHRILIGTTPLSERIPDKKPSTA
ncbi:PREDICTED: fatty acid hydroxylase domain-containing protein 2-like, partial [Priapulus caudatus]|uniref:Fatty acid hydroxylase domain-containing protein 2-like n=1 Tax=Priapulus caudatus TaxID=37621 RepID=A0ABM1E372_PRICU